jgi:hypothetical protein
MRSIERLRLIVLFTILAWFPGCSSSEQKIEQSARTAHSWEVTVRMASKHLEAGDVPQVYAKQILRAALVAQREQAQRSEWNSVPERTRRSLVQAITELAASLGEPIESLSRTP